jgi:hypothetical protein
MERWFLALKTQKSLNKVVASVFWEKYGILLEDYITAKNYPAILDKMKQQLVSKL